MNSFDQFVEGIITSQEEIDRTTKQVPCDISLALCNVDGFIENYPKFKDMDNKSAIEFVLYTHRYIFIELNKDRNKYKDFIIQLLSDNRYMTIVRDKVNLLNIYPEEKTAINKLIYRAMRQYNLSDTTILRNIATSINMQTVQILRGYGIDIELAINQAIAYNSTSKVRQQALLVNREIVNWNWAGYNPKTLESVSMIEQVIAHIYESLFPQVTQLFIAIMYDKMPQDQYDSMKEINQLVYSTIDLTILDMMEHYLSLDDTYDVIMAYVNSYKWTMDIVEPRFLLRSVNEDDYPRIRQVLRRMASQGIIVP